MVALPKPRPAAESDIDLFEKDLRSEMRRLVSENMSLGDPESFDFAMPKGYTKESTGSALIGDTNIPDPMNNIPLMISDDPDIIRADRRRQAKEFGEGLALGITTDLLGLPADILALVFRDAPQLAAALTKSVTTGTPVAEEIAEMNANPSLLDQALTAVQKYAGGDALAGYLGYSPEQLQRSGVLAGRIGAAAFDPFVLLGAGSRAKQVLQGEILPPEQGPSRQGIPTQGPIIEGDINQEGIGTLLPAPRTPDLVSDTPQVGFTGEVELPEGQPTRLQATGDITDVPTRSVAGIEDDFLDFTRPDADPDLGDEQLMQFEGEMIHVPTGTRIPAGSNVIGNIADFDTPAGQAATLANRTEFTQRMATPEETANFIENQGIAGLPASEDVIDVEPVVQTALTPIRTEGQQILRDEAFPITEDIASLPDAPAQPLPQQGDIIDYTPVYRQLQSLDPNQTYTPKGLASLLRALPENAERDLKNLGAVDDPMVFELTEDTYNQYLKAKNNDKSFSQFKTERDASQRPAPPFIKLKESNDPDAPPGELVFDSEVKAPQKVPDSGILRMLKGMIDAGQGNAPISKDFIVQLFEKSQPQVAVSSVQQSDAVNRNYLLNAEQRAELSSSDFGKMLEQVERLANEQNTFEDSALNDPTVMIFNNPTTGSFLGTPLKGVPYHDYWSDSVPGYYGHIRYTDLGEIDPATDQSTGLVFAGLIENQSNLQNAFRGAGKDFDAIENKDIILPSPELMYFLKGVEENISKDIVGINKAVDDVKQAEEAASRSDLLSDTRKEIEKEKSMVYYDSQFVGDILDQNPSDYSGTTGSRVANVSDAANKVKELSDGAFDDLLELEGFSEDELIASLVQAGKTDELVKILEDGLDNLENTNDFRNAEIHARNSTHHAKIKDGLGKDNSFGKAVFFLARHKAKRSDPIQFPETILDGYKIPDKNNEFDELNPRLARAPDEDPNSYKLGYTARETINNLVKRPDIDEDLLIQLFNREGPFDRRFGLPSYGGLSAQFGSDEAADAIVLALQLLMDKRNVITADQKIIVEDVLTQPAAMQEVANLGQAAATTQDFIRIFAENSSLKEMQDFARQFVGGPFNPFNVSRPELDRAGAVAEFMKLAEEDTKRIGQIAPGFLNIDVGDVMNMAQYGRARQTRNEARAALYNKLTTEFPGEVDTTSRFSPRNIYPDSDLYDQREFLQDVFEVEKEVQELIDSGKVLPTSEFDDDTLAEIVKSYATNQRRGFKIATPTPYSNAAQQQQHMYRAFIQEAVKKGYDGIVFPSPRTQAVAHALGADGGKVAEQVYGKSLAQAMKQINKEHPEFPTFEQAKSDFKYQTQGAGSTTDNAVVIRFTPEIKAIFEDRVIRRAKGGEVDLRPRKMIHSGIGAMAKEVM